MSSPILPLLCKYQQRASCLLCCSKASATLLTFIYICCQGITFLSYERRSRPACLNVLTHKFIIRTLGTRLRGPTCDSNGDKGVAPRHQLSKRRSRIYSHYQTDWTLDRMDIYVVKASVHTKSQYVFALTADGNFGTK